MSETCVTRSWCVHPTTGSGEWFGSLVSADARFFAVLRVTPTLHLQRTVQPDDRTSDFCAGTGSQRILDAPDRPTEMA